MKAPLFLYVLKGSNLELSRCRLQFRREVRQRVRGRCDILELFADFPDGLRSESDFVRTLFHRDDGLVRVALDNGDALLDFLRRLLRLFGELADLFRDDGEAASSFSCARCLNSRVQRQEVRLVGDGRNAFDDLSDLF